MFTPSIVAYNDTTGRFGGYGLALHNLLAKTLGELNKHIASKDVVMEFDVQIADLGGAFAQGREGWSYREYISKEGNDVVASSIMREARTGEDLNGGGADAVLRLSPQFMENLAQYQRAPTAYLEEMLTGVLGNEIGHAMGFNGLLDRVTGQPMYAIVRYLYDQNVVFENGKPYFVGEAAMAVFGGKVPLTAMGTGSSIYHVDVNASLMYGGVLSNYNETMLDIAMMRDLKYQVNYTFASADGHKFFIGAGTQSVAGTAGRDTAVIYGNYTEFTQSRSNGTIILNSKTDASTVDTLVDFERIKYFDKVVAFDTGGNAGQAYRLYQAAFDRKPDLAGLGAQINGLDSGMSLLNISQNFINSAEFQMRYGANPSNDAFVTQLYANVLHRTPDAGGYAVQVGALNGGMSRAQMLVNFSESTENYNATIVGIQSGIEYTPFA